ncbi:adenosylcobinamide-GDP ribazoletransferase [Nocardia macrotermitis]|uniref:Adenosylcobinamide-GDP ribazoletransferase n=1 Tax=Nocardia macrotermitis TaxID=2585198 RepID=A0A7K0D6H0_9NOCA|nr:adenosylcobinamide-GDP ribazoletransferase [Nocardia macrotermitis]MQY21355.1 Adenosylcobinamide-GDP ribazoletransferase [Nocardia macrotermitis]
MNGIRLAFSWLTVLPVAGPDEVDRAVAARAIAMAPVVGIVLGAAAAGLMWVLGVAGASFAVAGLIVVGALALITRGMHLDGLADTFDGLGSYGPPERAREIMKSGGAGPFGVAAMIFAIGLQAFSCASLAGSGRWVAIGAAVATGRVAVVLACRRGYEPAPGSGFGALVAGTQSPRVAVPWAVIALAAGFFAVPGRWWLGILAAAIGLIAAGILVRHCVTRFGGLNGDILGAALELSTTLTLVVAAFVVR